MLKKMLVVATLFATGVACAQICINATYENVKKTNQIDDHNKVAFDFEKFLLYIQVEQSNENPLKMNINIVPANQEASATHVNIEKEAKLNEEVTIVCPQTGTSITLVAEETN